MKLKYNAPVVLTFTLAAAGIMAASSLLGPGLVETFFRVPGRGEGLKLLSVGALRLVTHVLGHGSWAHLLGNFTLILLIGPILEEKYGSGALLFMMVATALVTGLLNVLLLDAGLYGASGIAFMMILLTSITNIRAGEIPLSFVLVLLLFMAKEVFAAFSSNNISEFAHIAGGICGAFFGFFFHSNAVVPDRAQSL
jgi:membrane associated rhomboid family serine protease